jgi:C-terminal processing protease CtpA/Prc
MRGKSAVALPALVLTCLVVSHAQDRDSSAGVTPVTARLTGLARVWGAAKFFHPTLAYEAIDWDAALIKAIPRVKAAETPVEYRDAVDSMLAALHDPMTTTELAAPQPAVTPQTRPASGAPPDPTYFRKVDRVIVVVVPDWVNTMMRGDGAAFSAMQQTMLAQIANADGVVIDCRYGSVPAGSAPAFLLGSYLDTLLPLLVRGRVSFGTLRYRQHNGYPPQRGNTSGDYASGMITDTPGMLVGQAREDKPLAVIVDEETPNLLPLLSGMQAGGARIVQIGVSKRTGGTQMHPIQLPDGVRVNLRVADFVTPDGGTGFKPDLQLASSEAAGERAIHSAIDAMGKPQPRRDPSATERPIMQGLKDDPYPRMPFPAEEYRLLALFRFWNVINYFYPYKRLMDRPWDSVLTEFIPRFLSNQTALQYNSTVAEMVARMQDSHGGTSGLPALNDELGMYAPPIRLAPAGSALTVVELVNDEAARAGIELGDVIQTIDGQPVAERLAFLTRFRSASTPQAAAAFIYPTALRGARDTVAQLRVLSVDGRTHDVHIARSVASGLVAGMRPRKTPIYQVLQNGFGYIDLARLPQADAQKAMDAVQQTPGLIFDMRGYPNGTAWQIGPRLTEKTHVAAALFRRPFQSAISFDDEGGRGPDYAFEQPLPARSGNVYKGRVVMLINEFAISQAEHTCLFFEAATNVTFIGSPTNGANGDVTNLVLPGGIYVNFTGHDVRHADGRQLQRVGIQPHIKVEPTPAGIHAGRDEVLEAAVDYLNKPATR